MRMTFLPFLDRRGFSIPLAVVFLFIAFLLGLGLFVMTRTQTSMSFHAHYNEVAFQMGESALDAALHHYGALLNRFDHELYRDLLKNHDSEWSLPDFTPDQFPPLAGLMRDYPGLDLHVESSLLELSPIPSNVSDPREKSGTLRLVAHVNYRNITKQLSTIRAFRYVNVIPPLAGRFTLFVKDARRESYNNLKLTTDGMTTGGRPLVLHNGRAENLLQNGWIYLGGGRVNLNLARGDKNFGEDFHLPPEITRSIFFPDQNYALLHANTGFFQTAGVESIFSRYPKKDTFNCSSLRLFGCPAASHGEASPTVVLGDVWRRYLQGAAIGSVKAGSIGKVAFMPWVINANQIPKALDFAPFLFLSSNLYRIYMSQVREEPYNRSFDFVISGDQHPTPLLLKQALKDRVGNIYPLDEPTVTIANCRNEEYFADSLKNVSFREGIFAKCSYSHDSFDDFLVSTREESGDEAVSFINGVHLFPKRRIDVSQLGPITYRGRGALVFQDSVKLGELIPENDAKDMLSIFVLKGNMLLEGRQLHAGLVCDEGEIQFQRGGQLRGVLAVKTLSPNELLKGCSLEYDLRCNPELPEYENFYAFSTEGRYTFFREE